MTNYFDLVTIVISLTVSIHIDMSRDVPIHIDMSRDVSICPGMSRYVPGHIDTYRYVSICTTKKCDIHTDIQSDQDGWLHELLYATNKSNHLRILHSEKYNWKIYTSTSTIHLYLWCPWSNLDVWHHFLHLQNLRNPNLLCIVFQNTAMCPGTHFIPSTLPPHWRWRSIPNS